MIRTCLGRLIEPFRGLQAKACITLVVIVVVTSAAVGTAAFRRARAQMVDITATQTLNSARLIAATCHHRGTTTETTDLISLCQQLVSDEHLLYAAFAAPDGRILAAAQKPHTLVELLDEQGLRLAAPINAGVHVRNLSRNVTAMEAAVPIPQSDTADQDIAMLLVATDLAPLQAQLADMAHRSIKLTCMVAILVIIIGSFVMRHLVRPLNKLAAASMDLAYKHEYRRIDIRRGDELGKLTQAFNHMAGRLLRTQRDLMQLNTELEKRVAIRTMELETRNKQLRRIASKDPLTGLYNRRSFNELLARQMAEAQRYHRELACMMIDVDNFKQVNDLHGHQVGDCVLRKVAEVIRQQARQCDITARYGGDEFVLLLPQCNALEAFSLAKRIREQVQLVLGELATATPRVSLSVGIADLHVSDAKTGEMLVNAADKALYKVKSLGKDGIGAAKMENAQVA